MLETIAIILSPIVALWITNFYQKRERRYNAKSLLFSTLIMHRKSFPPTAEWVNALNMIDIIFTDNKIIVDKWHEYYKVLNQKPMNTEGERHAYLELLSLMAQTLGYKKLLQTDIDKFYTPQAHADAYQFNEDLKKELLRVLKCSGSIVVTERVGGDLISTQSPSQQT